MQGVYQQQRMTLAELGARAGVPGRTIRYYIARGLLPGPRKSGRGAEYGGEHLARLEEIRRRQTAGETLHEIGADLGHGVSGRVEEALPAGVAWWEYRVAEDVVVAVRAGASPWRLRRIRRELARLASSLGAGATGEGA